MGNSQPDFTSDLAQGMDEVSTFEVDQRLPLDFRHLQFPNAHLEHLSDMPASEIFAEIVRLPLREVDLLAVEAYQPFLKAFGPVGVV